MYNNGKGEKISEETFEPQEKVDIMGQTEHLYAQRPIWLRGPWINITANFEAIIQAFQDLRFIGELRERWNEIKRLQLKPSVVKV